MVVLSRNRARCAGTAAQPAIPVPRITRSIGRVATRTQSLDQIVQALRARQSLPPLLTALGFDPVMEVIPQPAWAAYGLRWDSRGSGEPSGLVVAGRAGTLDALLIEMKGVATAEDVRRIASMMRSHNPARLHLFVFACDRYSHFVVATFGLDGRFHHLSFERSDTRESDLDALEEMQPAAGEVGLELALRHVRALDRSRVTRRFFNDFRAQREAVSEAWRGLAKEERRDRQQLALLFLSRLTFLYFLQRRRVLAGDDRYLARLLGQWAVPQNPSPPRSFYQARLLPLFFGALNRRPEERSPDALELGDLPYLNGGLFEPRAVEQAHPELDLPDAVVRDVLEGLLERYRFTSREAGEGAGYGVDPEVLGRVFEGLMAPDQRGDTGSFYTPAPVVNRVVKEAVSVYLRGQAPDVDAEAVLEGDRDPLSGAQRYRVRKSLEWVRILDPACGSGAFLLGALHQITRARSALSGPPAGEIRRDVVARSLHGLDLLDDAALLCSLRLWLALTDGEVRPLPNLDRRIRQGDALVDPLDVPVLGTPTGVNGGFAAMRDPRFRRALAALGPAARAYLESHPDDRERTRDALREAERRLGSRWVERLSSVQEHRIRELSAEAGMRDLFGDVPDAARRAARARDREMERLRELRDLGRQIEDRGALPFFSFRVHFGGERASFDLVVSNPPWVRSHKWPDRLRSIAARRFDVCRNPGWPAGAELTGSPAAGGAQVDLSLLFIEQSLRLLSTGGVLAMLVPAKAFRALYGGAARRMLLRDLELATLEDHALDQRSVFRADAFTAIVVGRRRPPAPDSSDRLNTPSDHRPSAADGTTKVRMIRRGVDPLSFVVRERDLPLFPGDEASPWLLSPPDVARAFRRMQRAGEPLGKHQDLRVRRGVMTGANDVLVMRTVQPKLGGLSRIEAEGHKVKRRAGDSSREAGRFRAHVETEGLRPLVRGADIDAFSYRIERHLAWCHGPEAEPADPPERLGRYLRRHRSVLEARSGWRPGRPLGSVFRIGRWTLTPKVAWHDLSDTLRAVALPRTTRFDGRERLLVPLNTVYFLPMAAEADAVLLAGLLNSLPVRTLARAIAERAKDARFRFFAWTVSCIPLPAQWRTAAAASEIRDVSVRAHSAGGISADDQQVLDRAAAALYGLRPTDVEALRRFDRWLRGVK